MEIVVSCKCIDVFHYFCWKLSQLLKTLLVPIIWAGNINHMNNERCMSCIFDFAGLMKNQWLKLLCHASVLIFAIAFVYKLQYHENNFRTTYCPPLSLTMGILVGMWVVCFYFVGLMKKQGLKLMCHDTGLMFFNQFLFNNFNTRKTVSGTHMLGKYYLSFTNW